MGNFVMRFVKWIPMNFMTILGVIRAIVKLFKELFTGLVNAFYPVFNPETSAFCRTIMKVRDFFNAFDALLERAQAFLLKLTGA